VPWASVLAAHRDEVIVEIGVQAGSGGAYTDGTTAYADNVVIDAGGKRAQYDFGG
jgi:hypothetical protein